MHGHALELPHIWTPGAFDFKEATRRFRDKLRDNILGSEEREWCRAADDLREDMIRRVAIAGFSDAVEAKILDHVFNDGTYAAPTPYLALGTGAIQEADVAASFGGSTEANYTSYARLAIAAADMSAAAAGSKTNGNVLTLAGCTGSSAVVIAWCVCSAGPARLAAGDVIVGGTTTSTTIDTTHTPPSFAAGGLVTNLD
jgi:hypothetical protein